MRAAFTLLEMVLVLAILVVAVSIAVPTFDGMITSRRVLQSIERVQLELQKGRLEAIRSGQSQVFRCQIGQGLYVVQPWLRGSDEVEASAGATLVTQFGQAIETEATSAGVVATQAEPTTEQKTLEEGVVFADAQILNDQRAVSEQTIADGMAAANTGWSMPILLYPDGSTTTAHVVVQDLRGRRMAVQLRGLTGEAKVLEVASAGGP